MQTMKTFQRTAQRKNGDLPQNPENKGLSCVPKNLKDLQTDQTATYEVHTCDQDSQRQVLLKHICQIYQNTIVHEAFQLQQSLREEKIREMVRSINEEIERLQQREEQYIELFRRLQNPSKKMGNEQKWKLVVLTYKEKITKFQNILRQQRESKLKLQETIELQIEQKQRLSQLNNIKYRKINNLMSDLQQKQNQLEELNQTISQLQCSMSQLKQANSVLEVRVQQFGKENVDLCSHLDYQREKTFLLAQQREQIVSKFKVLGDQEQQINKQIRDLKAKYEIQIAKLQNKIANLTIQNQQLLLLIEQLQMNELKTNFQKNVTDEQTQTQNEVVKACYFNSLADQLSDYNEESMDFQSENNAPCNQSKNCQYNAENIPQQFNLHLDLGTNSQHNHETYTERLVDRQSYEKETLSERGLFAARVQTSFDDGNSVSNTPSKYLETMGELTNELADAYQKINELTAKVGQLEGEKLRIDKKLRQNQSQNETKTNQRQKRGFGYFSSFFKK